MSNAYIEPRPRGRAEGDPIEYYVILREGGIRITDENYKTQKEAIDAAKKLGFHPLVSRVRNTDVSRPDLWRSAS